MTRFSNLAHDPDAIAEMVERYRAGETLNALAEEFHASCDTLRRFLKLAGVPIRPKGFRHRRGGTQARRIKEVPREHKDIALPIKGLFWQPTAARLMSGR